MLSASMMMCEIAGLYILFTWVKHYFNKAGGFWNNSKEG